MKDFAIDLLLPEEERDGSQPADRGLVSLLCSCSSEGVGGKPTDEATEWLADIALDIEGAPTNRLH